MFNLIQALVAIKDKPEFKHNIREGYSVIDYMVSNRDTFEGKIESETYILKNLRGTCFDDDGEISRLGFEKFHNYLECSGYMDTDIDFTAPHSVLEKLDGSCIFMIRIGDSTRLGTRAGITDIALMAEDFVKNSPIKADYDCLFDMCHFMSLTPIFEFTSRKNKVVIDYPEDGLTLLAIRDYSNGDYIDYNHLWKFSKDIPIVRVIANQHSTLKDLSKYVSNWNENSEGVVVTFDSGFHVKIKCEDYVLKHRSIDMIRFEKSVLKMIIENTVDDVLPLIDVVDKKRIIDYSASVKKNLNIMEKMIIDVYNSNKHLNRKDFAESISNHPKIKSFLFLLYSGKDMMIPEFVIKNCSSQTTVDSIRPFIGTSFYDFKG